MADQILDQTQFICIMLPVLVCLIILCDGYAEDNHLETPRKAVLFHWNTISAMLTLTAYEVVSLYVAAFTVAFKSRSVVRVNTISISFLLLAAFLLMVTSTAKEFAPKHPSNKKKTARKYPAFYLPGIAAATFTTAVIVILSVFL